MTSVRNVIVLICVLLSATIGAGFATGREIVVFFNCSGTMLPLYILIFIFAYIVMSITLFMLGRWIGKYTKIRRCYDIYLLLSGILMSGCLLSAVRSIGDNISGVFGIILVIITLISVLLICRLGLSGFEKFSLAVVPAILFIIFYITLHHSDRSIDIVYGNNIFSPIVYSAMNLCFIGYVLGRLGQQYKPRECVLASILGGIIVGIIVFSIRMYLYGTPYEYLDMPILAACADQGYIFVVLYNILLYLAILSTIICTLSTAMNYINDFKHSRASKVVVIMIILSLSCIPFGLAVSHIYPIIGYSGAVFMILFMFLVLRSKYQVPVMEKKGG